MKVKNVLKNQKNLILVLFFRDWQKMITIKIYVIFPKKFKKYKNILVLSGNFYKI